MNQNPFPFKKRENPLSTGSTVKSVSSSQREKYTATMEKEMRIRVKIASAKRGMQFSQFIEEAVSEKLDREGE
jgi:hypothetical protein